MKEPKYLSQIKMSLDCAYGPCGGCSPCLLVCVLVAGLATGLLGVAATIAITNLE